jgi:hypothetical protein
MLEVVSYRRLHDPRRCGGGIYLTIPGVYLIKIISLVKGQKPLGLLAPRDGLEPPTQWLTATCSTD